MGDDIDLLRRANVHLSNGIRMYLSTRVYLADIGNVSQSVLGCTPMLGKQRDPGNNHNTI